MANLALSKVVMTFNSNPYNSSTSYPFLEAVYDVSTNTTYLSLQDNNTGSLPVYPVIVNENWIVLCKGIGVTTDNNFTNAYKTKLDGIENSANNYIHPTGDGNHHVPATGTTNNGKVLKAGATVGSESWGTLTSSDTGSVPTTRQIAGLALSSDITKAQLIATGIASADTSGNATNALSLGGILASNYATMTNTTLTLLNGWTVSQTYTPKAYKCGNLVVVTGNITGGTVGNGTSLATLPVGYRPSLNQWVQIFTFSGAQYSALINTDGVIGQIGTWSSSEIVRFNFVIGL